MSTHNICVNEDFVIIFRFLCGEMGLSKAVLK